MNESLKAIVESLDSQTCLNLHTEASHLLSTKTNYDKATVVKVWFEILQRHVERSLNEVEASGQTITELVPNTLKPFVGVKP